MACYVIYKIQYPIAAPLSRSTLPTRGMPTDGMQQYFEKSVPKREAPTKGI